MKKFRYELSGKWYKGNIHIHSTLSDGGKNLKQLAELYSSLNYDFLCRTDHWIASDVESDKNHYPILWLDGLELNGSDSTGSEYHVLCLGRFTGITQQMGFENALKAIFKQKGIVILAHPYWTGNSVKDALRWKFHGVESYNHVVGWINGKSDSSVFWDMMLRKNINTLAFAVDDAHINLQYPAYGGGWICVNSKELSRKAIDESIRAGNFYSSCGPQIKDIIYNGQKVIVKTSPVRFIRLVGPAWRGLRKISSGEASITNADFEVPPDWQYAYIEIEDNSSKRAWTNTLFTSE